MMSYIVILMSFTAIFPSIGYAITNGMTQLSVEFAQWRKQVIEMLIL
jgi:hypothetical protein